MASQNNEKTNDVLQKIKKNALSFTQLHQLVGTENTQRCRWIVYDDLRKYSSLEQLMSLGAVVILLMIEKPNAPKVGHFILLLDHKSHYEHFDSYGLTMDQEISLTQEHHLTKLFSNSRKKIVDNRIRLQQIREDINTCGRWVVTRYLLKDLELDDFIRLIKFFVRPSDDLVAAMTLLLQFKK